MAVVRLHRESPPSSNSESAISVTEFTSRLKAAGLDAIPVNVTAVAEMLGLTLKYEVMEDDLSGVLEKRGSCWTIAINAYHHPNRQRYSIAHELGHYVLHRGKQSRFVDETFARRNGKASNSMEKEADQFAADLLMPSVDVRGMIKSGVSSLQELAQRFGVSSMAMQVRVQSIGYTVT